jgi:hypothetical protein
MSHSKLCLWLVLLTILVWKLLPFAEAQAGPILSNMASTLFLVVAYWAWSLQPKPKPAKAAAKK